MLSRRSLMHSKTFPLIIESRSKGRFTTFPFLNFLVTHAPGTALREGARAKRVKQTDRLLDRIVDATDDSVVAAYEKRIAKLKPEKVLAEERLTKSGKPKHTFEESFKHAMVLLSSPWNIWNNSDLTGKKTTLRLAFLEPLAYCRNQGLRTPNLSFSFKALGKLYGENSKWRAREDSNSRPPDS